MALAQSIMILFFFFFLTKRSHGCASQRDCLAGNLTLVLQLLKHHLNLSPQCPPNAHCRIQGLLFIETGTVSLCFPRLPESFLANDKLFSCSFQCRNCQLQLSKFLYLLEIEFHLFLMNEFTFVEGNPGLAILIISAVLSS